MFGFEVRGRDVTVLTGPRDERPQATAPEADLLDRWFCANARTSDPESVPSREKQ